MATGAPSGTAAFLIGGETLHSLLTLPVNQKQDEPIRPLGSGKLHELQKRFRNVGLLVIDEKSMIGKTRW